MKIDLTVRQQTILRATVRSYIETAEPVGSRTLANTYELGVSTATIRNVMAMLERGGLLFQPHTSAGRIPSDRGYRVYVDNLIEEPINLQASLLKTLGDRLGEGFSDNLEALLDRSTHILATLSGCIALITAPPTDTAIIRHLQLIPVDGDRIMAILVTDTYQTHSVLLNLNTAEDTGSTSAFGHHIAPFSRDDSHMSTLPATDTEKFERDLHLLSNFLNLQLRGKTFYDILSIDWGAMDRQFRSYSTWLQQLLDILKQNYLRPEIGQVFVGGMAGLLQQPEFSELTHIQDVVQLLEQNQTDLWPVLEPSSSERVVLYIGSENPLAPMRQFTLVSTGYSCGSWAMGSINILGPTRLPYERAIAAVKATSNHLSNTLGGNQNS